MRIDLACCGFKTNSIKISADIEDIKVRTINNIIVIESPQNNINRLTIKRKTLRSSKLCYLNILNPIYYFYQNKLHNSDVYFYDKDYLWLDIIFNERNTNTYHKFKLTKVVKSIESTSRTIDTIEISGQEKTFRVESHKMPKNEILRYKISNILCQIFWSSLIIALALSHLFEHNEDIGTCLFIIFLILIFTGGKIFKYAFAKSATDFYH